LGARTAVWAFAAEVRLASSGRNSRLRGAVITSV
jgi:hypothetical protein